MADLEINDTAHSGTGLLAIFCDLTQEDQEDFRPWLTEDMFPARMNIGFNACASFDQIDGSGPEFLTLYEMPSLGHLYGEPYQALRQTRTSRDAAYHEKFQNPERYTLSLTGPELSGPSAEFASYVYVDRFDLTETDIQAFNIWFVGTYLPELAKLSGLIRVRRYLAMEGTPQHFILYEFQGADVVNSSDWQKMRAEIPSGSNGLYHRAV